MTKKDSPRTGAGRRLPAQVRRAVDAVRDRQAVDPVVLDLRPAQGFTDYFVICSGQNARHIKAIADTVELFLGRIHVKPAQVEGYDRADWVLLDYFDFIVHVFNADTRAFYALERLWGNAERVDLPPDVPDRR
jgi:ribosome-associated protein